jgi:hypothetical protein
MQERLALGIEKAHLQMRLFFAIVFVWLKMESVGN